MAACEPATLPTVYRNALMSVGVWTSGGSDAVPACLEPGLGQVAVLVAASGVFTEPGGAPAILARLAEVSHYPRMRYWSVTRQRWRELVTDAALLMGPQEERRPGDIAIGDMRAGSAFQFWQEENTPASSVIYEMTVEEAAPDRIAVAIANRDRVRRFGFTLFDRREYRLHHAFHRLAGDQWQYDGEIRIQGTGNPLLAERGASYANRAEGAFRYLAGLPDEAGAAVAP